MPDKHYRVKEIFYTLQGEGAHTGRPAVFCRFSKCNLWNGREDGRATAVCKFCDTDFIGTDGQNGGEYYLTALVDMISSLWPNMNLQPDKSCGQPYVVCTGGEPALQLDEVLVSHLQEAGFEVAIETNGTLPLPSNLDWVCLSPKANSELVIDQCDELKLVYPQELAMPETFTHIKAKHYFLQPMANYQTNIIAKENLSADNTQATLEYCLHNPRWKLSTQTHKIIGID